MRLDACSRIMTIHQQIIPDMLANAKEEQIFGIKQASIDYLPQLENKAFLLAGKCVKDDGCPDDCYLCEPEVIGELFDNARQELGMIT